MRPFGFVKCNVGHHPLVFTKGKIYPYYSISQKISGRDFALTIFDNFGSKNVWSMFLDDKPINEHWFEFYHLPEFPKDISTWTEDDWFQYDLKYG